MKSACRIAIAVLLLVSMSPAGIAQMGMMRTPDMSGIWNPVVGAGGSYEMQSADGKTRHLDIFIAGKERVGGKDAYWMEIAVEGGQRPGTTIRSKIWPSLTDPAVQSEPDNHSDSGPTADGIVRADDGRDASRANSATFAFWDRIVGSETITVPAGTFACEHWHSNNGSDVWISPKVPPFGLVKSTNKEGSTSFSPMFSATRKIESRVRRYRSIRRG